MEKEEAEEGRESQWRKRRRKKKGKKKEKGEGFFCLHRQQRDTRGSISRILWAGTL